MVLCVCSVLRMFVSFRPVTAVVSVHDMISNIYIYIYIYVLYSSVRIYYLHIRRISGDLYLLWPANNLALELEVRNAW